MAVFHPAGPVIDSKGSTVCKRRYSPTQGNACVRSCLVKSCHASKVRRDNCMRLRMEGDDKVN